MIEALYLHIPFCVKRCAYCDFATSECHDEALMDSYVDALCLQLRRASRAGLLGAVKTIYIGGGTPTHLGARRLNSLVYMISLSVNLENVVEFTVEANPDSIDARMVKDLFALGVDRFSIGAQSFDDAVLAAYGRVHDAEQIERAVSCVGERAENYSLDLICGGPGQRMESWEDSLRRALALNPAHLSIYPLILEEGTPLSARVDSGELEAGDDGLEAEMMRRAEDMLVAAGMHRYEVASYARPGFESKHNTAYWTGVEYLGLGAGSSSMLAPESYEACLKAGIFGDVSFEEVVHAAARIRLASDRDAAVFAKSEGHPMADGEMLDARQAVMEDLMLAFRRSEGADDALVARASCYAPEVKAVLTELEAKGLIERTSRGFAPTDLGWLCGNEVYGAIWDLAKD